MPHSTLTAALAKRFARDRRAAARAAARNGLLGWSRAYLPNHFTKPPSAMHRWLADQLDGLRAEKKVPGTFCAKHPPGRSGKRFPAPFSPPVQKINLIGPRGAAKSTIATLAHVLRTAVEGREPYIWIVSDTKNQAQAHLDNIKNELTDNEHLIEDYPNATGQGPRWRANSIELVNGVGIEAFGTGQRIRGRRLRAHRPTLIIADDLQNDRHIVSSLARETSRQWFFGTLLKAGTPETNIVNLATALHRDAIALVLDRTPGWRSAIFRAIERWPDRTDLWKRWEAVYCNAESTTHAEDARMFYEVYRDQMDAGSEVLWPVVEDLYTLMTMRAESGPTAFAREKQSEPIDPERCEWPESYFGDDVWFEKWPKRLAVRTMALDPSKGKDARHGDYSAYVMLGVCPKGVVYVEADLARRPTPKMVADGVDLVRRFTPDALGIEANTFQELLCGEFTRELASQGISGITPTAIHNHAAKSVRIRRLGPLLAKRRLRFHKSSPGTRLLVDQLRDFPLASHDDGPDAAEMALRLAEEVLRRRQQPSDGLGETLVP